MKLGNKVEPKYSTTITVIKNGKVVEEETDKKQGGNK